MPSTTEPTDPTPAAPTVSIPAPKPAPDPTSHAAPAPAAHAPAAATDPTAHPAPAPAAAGVAGGRERIDAIDAELIALIQRRVAVSGEIQAARLAEGGRRLDLRRETEVIGRYTRALGRSGTAVAMALLELGRGRV